MGQAPDSKYSSLPADYIDGLINFPDGEIRYSGPLRNRNFLSEKQLSDFIVLNADKFFEQNFNQKLLWIKQDREIREFRNFGPRGRRVDLVAQCNESLFIIELKNPKQPIEVRAAIGQILDYGREFSDPKKELVIITTLFDAETAKTIKHYKLPIRYIYFDKAKSMEFKRIEGAEDFNVGQAA